MTSQSNILQMMYKLIPLGIDHMHCWICNVCLYSVIIFSLLLSLYHCIIASFCRSSRIHLWNYDGSFILFIFCSFNDTGFNLFRKGPAWKVCNYWENSSIVNQAIKANALKTVFDRHCLFFQYKAIWMPLLSALSYLDKYSKHNIFGTASIKCHWFFDTRQADYVS